MAEKKRINPWDPEKWSLHEEINSSLPKITLGILNYNRREDLRRTLECITIAIQYPDFEVIVVDNGSSDGSAEMVKEKFPEVGVIALEKNIGISARNNFYNEAKGKYIFSYDDDSFPATPATIYHAVEFLEKHPNCGAISFYCLLSIIGFGESGEAGSKRYHGDPEKGFEGVHYVEGGMCIRSSTWKAIEGYDPEFFWGAEGLDLSLQIFREGIKNIYHAGYATLHMKSSLNRNINTNVYFFTRNTIWTIAKHFSLYIAIPLTSVYIIRRLVGILLHPSLAKGYIQGIFDGIKGYPSQRKKTSKLTLKQAFILKDWYYPLVRW